MRAHAATYKLRSAKSDDPAISAEWSEVGDATHALFEYSHFPRLMAAFRRRNRNITVLVRAHNIEPLQHLDNNGLCPERGVVWLGFGLWRLFRQDRESARKADAVLSINEWENRVYWRWLAGEARTDWLPYVCPEDRVPQMPETYGERRIIACVPTSQKNRKSWDLVVRFLEMARKMRRMGCEAEFVLTGRLDDWGLPPCPEVRFAGFVADLPSLLGRCRAVALLSPLGYGFKTTLADAWAAGAHVLAHPSLVRRSPSEVASNLIGMDSKCEADVSAALEALHLPSRGEEWHASLARRFDETMRKWFIA